MKANNLNSSNPAVTTSTETPKDTNRSSLADTSHTNQFEVSNAHLLSTSDFNPPGQFAFDTPYYTGRHSESTSPVTYSASNTDAQSEEFGYGLGSNNHL